MTILESKCLCLKFIFLVVILLLPAGAQEFGERQKAGMLNCALRANGGWVESSLYAKGKVSFSYTLEPSEDKDSRQLYVAFWNSARNNEGELLVFNFSKTSDHRDLFILNNQGWIWDNNGHPDIRDSLWGVYTRRKIQLLLPRLKRKPPMLVAVDQLQPSSAVCETPVDLKNSKN